VVPAERRIRETAPIRQGACTVRLTSDEDPRAGRRLRLANRRESVRATVRKGAPVVSAKSSPRSCGLAIVIVEHSAQARSTAESGDVYHAALPSWDSTIQVTYVTSTNFAPRHPTLSIASLTLSETITATSQPSTLKIANCYSGHSRIVIRHHCISRA
jgi:hypothetical protein